MWMLLKCESPSESRLELTRVEGRQHGPRAPHTGSGLRQGKLTRRSEFSRGHVNRSGFLKCPRSQARKVYAVKNCPTGANF